MGLASRLSSAPATFFVAVLCVLGLFGVPSPAWAEMVKYEYVLDITGIKGAVEESPFDLSEDVQVFGSFSLGNSRKENDPVDSARRSDMSSITDSVFAFSWETGRYESGTASEAKYQSNFVGKDQGSGARSDVSLALGLSRFTDRSGFAPFGAYEFASLKIKLKNQRNAQVSSDGSPPDLLDLEAFGNTSFSLRFIDGSEKITYTGDVSSLEALAASGMGSDADVAVPLPPSLYGCLGGFGLIWLLRFRGARRFRKLDQSVPGPVSGRQQVGAS